MSFQVITNSLEYLSWKIWEAYSSGLSHSNPAKCVFRIPGHINWQELRKNQCNYDDTFHTSDIDLSVIYKQDIRFHGHSYGYSNQKMRSIFYASLSVFYKDQNDKDQNLTKLDQFSKSSFGEICSYHLITSSYMELVSRWVCK